jgi:hypothetical protein
LSKKITGLPVEMLSIVLLALLPLEFNPYMAGLHAQAEVKYKELLSTFNAVFRTRPFIMVKKTSSINLTEIEAPPPPAGISSCGTLFATYFK